ncbi:unnamed protein product [Arctia plantaginis]|uniref:Methyltransferase domain-containing protein n=1 Tax=Arctia plantaginis TaxID=874455 RepID=A0A8S0YVI0_ARCPL|nr:unnamed protein product [Arctia plantaginis]CAB3247934.1 unnamed protein product [Arctia plantaginis]
MYDPELYHQCNDIPKRDALLCLEKHAPALKWKMNNNRIIDLGCGDGSVTNILKNFLPTDYKLLGCDISKNMVLFASKYNSNEQTSFTVLDIAGDLPEDMKGNFDYVFSFYALNWIADQKQAFENVFNLMDRGGECFMTLAGYFPFYEVYRTLSRSKKWSTWMPDVEKHISPYHDSKAPDIKIMKLMKNIGFVNVNVDCKDMVFVYDNEEIMRKHTAAVNPFKIPKNMSDDFINDYIEALKDIEQSYNVTHERNANNSSKDVTLHYKLLIVYGRKPSE